ncbi:Zinc finger, BED-type [Dillenia turbinata]|uniref:Zinc finger, BED-type n=1 Tax=Dillenia turbinata TaxID=194707 RepID=A0AAN8UTL1_9MAGN
MALGDIAINVHDHGTALDDKKGRVKCNYCGKEVSGFTRLKYHLGGVGHDVTSCKEVPRDIGRLFRDKLLEMRRGYLRREVGNLSHPELPCKRNSSSGSSNVKHIKLEPTQTGGSSSRRHIETTASAEDDAAEQAPLLNRRVGTGVFTPDNATPSLPKHAQKCIGRFFFEADIDFSVAKSTSFQNLIDSTLGYSEIRCKIPAVEELKGWILEEEVNEIQQYVDQIKLSWASTGCSILLDVWKGEGGQSLIYFLVDCPKGVIFLHACDVSAIAEDAVAMQLIIEGILEEVGVDNVVQIITNCTMGCIGTVGKLLTEKYRTLFWTVSATHCIELMLDRMRMMDQIKNALDKARIITKFIYSHATVIKLMQYHINGHNLIKPHKIKSVVPFLTLENIVLERENLKQMFISSEWRTSIWASRPEGRKVADLVGNSGFWNEAEIVLSGCIPLVNVLRFINGKNKPLMGFIYDTLDHAKETIKGEFGNMKAEYMEFWKIIDEYWDNYLHSPLHAAGYYLNPVYYYSSDFHLDDEVSNGLFSCISRMSKDQQTEYLIGQQLRAYQKGEGDFARGKDISCKSHITADAWWSRYGEKCPDLQKQAIRILGQTFDGAYRYALKRDMAEKLLKDGMNPLEQQQIKDLIFVHYNLHSQQFEFDGNGDEVIDEIDPFDD